MNSQGLIIGLRASLSMCVITLLYSMPGSNASETSEPLLLQAERGMLVRIPSKPGYSYDVELAANAGDSWVTAHQGLVAHTNELVVPFSIHAHSNLLVRSKETPLDANRWISGLREIHWDASFSQFSGSSAVIRGVRALSDSFNLSDYLYLRFDFDPHRQQFVLGGASHIPDLGPTCETESELFILRDVQAEFPVRIGSTLLRPEFPVNIGSGEAQLVATLQKGQVLSMTTVRSPDTESYDILVRSPKSQIVYSWRVNGGISHRPIHATESGDYLIEVKPGNGTQSGTLFGYINGNRHVLTPLRHGDRVFASLTGQYQGEYKKYSVQLRKGQELRVSQGPGFGANIGVFNARGRLLRNLFGVGPMTLHTAQEDGLYYLLIWTRLQEPLSWQFVVSILG